MNLGSNDDAATVLEQFCVDVNNLPAEIAHLMEEIAARDAELLQCREAVAEKDNALQKHIRTSQVLAKHPKEDAFNKIILANYDRMQALSAEKVALSSKLTVVLDRQVKRLDMKVRSLQLTDQFPHDPTLPSLLNPASSATDTPLSAAGTPVSLSPLSSAQIGGAPNMATAAAARVAGSQAVRNLSPVPSGAASHMGTPRSTGDGGSEVSKRRRLNTSLSTTAIMQSARQTSLGPSAVGTPKSGTPGANSARSTSAQPARPAASRKSTSKRAGHAADGASAALSATDTQSGAARNKRSRASLAQSTKKGDRRRQLAQDRLSGSRSPTHSTSPGNTAHAHGNDGANDVDSDSEVSSPESENEFDEALVRKARASSGIAASNVQVAVPLEDSINAGDAGDADEELWCVCQRPQSFGNMVACDNGNCKIMWYHEQCVGLIEPPIGDWYCADCRKLPKSQIVRVES